MKKFSEMTDRELDKEIAEKVFELSTIKYKEWMIDRGRVGTSVDPSAHYVDHIKNYSTNISDAWLVANKMRELGYDLCMVFHDKTKMDHNIWFYCVETDKFTENVFNKSAPRAICIAALKALENQMKKTDLS